ncbi:MAG: hypothetical protein OEZ33_10685, partial [Gammaproteobacteria bacterium]|nr:hypothetical protein [Gammaproteobacteria bacterium]
KSSAQPKPAAPALTQVETKSAAPAANTAVKENKPSEAPKPAAIETQQRAATPPVSQVENKPKPVETEKVAVSAPSTPDTSSVKTD